MQAHRSRYDEREPIEVRVEKDMIEIISHPRPDRSVTLEGLQTFKVRSRRYRNRRIGEFLKELHLTEGRNTGFKKILDALARNRSPLPEFETDDAHDYFITRLFVREGFYDYEGTNEEGNEGSTTPELPPSDPRNLILHLTRENPKIKRKEIAAHLGMTLDGVRYHLKKLADAGILEFEGNSRTGHWVIHEGQNHS